MLSLLPVRLPQKWPPPLIQAAGCRTPKAMHPSLHIAVVSLPVSHAPIFMAIPLSAHTEHDLLPAACGQRVNGYSAAVNELAFGANDAAGGACGRCFKISLNYDPYTPSYAGPFGNSIVVKVNDLCPASNNNMWCGQRVSKPLNSYGVPMQCVAHTFPFILQCYNETRDVLKNTMAASIYAWIRVLRMHFSLANVARCLARTRRSHATSGPVVMARNSGMARAWPARALICGQNQGAPTEVRTSHLPTS